MRTPYAGCAAQGIVFARWKEKTVPEIYVDKKEQLPKIQSILLPRETVDGVFEMKGGGTGFIGLTSHRVIVDDKAFLRKMKAIVSIPYAKVTSIAAEDDRGLVTGRGFFASSNVVMKAGTETFEFEFRGAGKAHYAHNLMLPHTLYSDYRAHSIRNAAS